MAHELVPRLTLLGASKFIAVTRPSILPDLQLLL